jgi:hypothetical protein
LTRRCTGGECHDKNFLIEAIAIEQLPADFSGAWQIVDLASSQDHVMLRVMLPRTHEEARVTFSREGLKRLRTGLAHRCCNLGRAIVCSC